jgi:Protein of unknown function (DUF3565)
VSDGGPTRRAITGFRQDAEGDWVAELSCQHTQHMRHNPPLNFRPWVTDPAGRQDRIGTKISCPPCDQARLPEGLTRLAAGSDQPLPPGIAQHIELGWSAELAAEFWVTWPTG